MRSRLEAPGLYCVELRSAEWERCVEWYRNVLGLRVLVRVSEDGYALLGAGETRLALLRRANPGAASARISLAFEVHDLDGLIGRLSAAGVAVQRRADDQEGLREVNVVDPDGNHLRLFAWPRG